MSTSPEAPTTDAPVLAGKVALVTGAYGDIGQHTVLGLARAGATVIGAGRNAIKLEQLVRLAATQVPGAQIETLVLDLADLGSVKRAAETVLSTARPVDILINNAAVMPGRERQTTGDGFELAFGTNHLGHYALTGQLLPALLTAPEARVVTVCAGPPNQRLDTSDLNSERRYKGGMRTYMTSKLATAVFAQELARRAAATTVKSLTANPGVAATGVQRNNPLIGWLARYVFAPVASTPEQAARPSVYAATRTDLANGSLVGPTGMKGAPRLRKVPAAVADQATGQQLWQASEELTGISYKFSRPDAPEDGR
jgi:NAD(P)-dependent dehydrogenase (short-subunit alcohol dehydrogenase family)